MVWYMLWCLVSWPNTHTHAPKPSVLELPTSTICANAYDISSVPRGAHIYTWLCLSVWPRPKAAAAAIARLQHVSGIRAGAFRVRLRSESGLMPNMIRKVDRSQMNAVDGHDVHMCICTCLVASIMMLRVETWIKAHACALLDHLCVLCCKMNIDVICPRSYYTSSRLKPTARFMTASHRGSPTLAALSVCARARAFCSHHTWPIVLIINKWHQ